MTSTQAPNAPSAFAKTGKAPRPTRRAPPPDAAGPSTEPPASKPEAPAPLPPLGLPAACSRLALPEGYSLALLGPADRPALLSHWLRLSEEDRRLRFFSFAPDALLASRAGSLNFQAPRLVGALNPEGLLVACGEWVVDPQTPGEAECAFSCDASERGQGLSKTLGLACFLDAAQFGVSRARIETLRENASARALARSLGARWVPEGPGFGVARAEVSVEANPALRSLMAPLAEPARPRALCAP